jgi:hypothetical protein
MPQKYFQSAAVQLAWGLPPQFNGSLSSPLRAVSDKVSVLNLMA